MKLDLGCGDQKPVGYIGLDRVEDSEADIVQDLEEETRLPFDDNSLDRVRARHILEHLEEDSLREVLQEVNRVLKPEGLFVVVVPHFLSWNSATVDHNQFFGRKGFDLFTEDHVYPSQASALFKLQDQKFILEKNLQLVNYLSIFLDSRTIATYIPNAVKELKFTLKPSKGGSSE